MITDTTADFLARMQNAVLRKSKQVSVVRTKMVLSILEILKKEGMIVDYVPEDRTITVELAYDNGEPVVSKFQKISKSGQRIYVSSNEIYPVVNGRGIGIISTSSGLLNSAQAKAKSLGGEYICKIW